MNTRIVLSPFKFLLAVALAAAFLAVSAPEAAAQSADAVFEPSQLSALPKVASPSQARRLIQRSYPDELRRRGVGGKVQVQFIVGTNGRVEPSSINVVSASAPALADAVIEVARNLKFKPGEKDGKPVRARVILPIVYSP